MYDIYRMDDLDLGFRQPPGPNFKGIPYPCGTLKFRGKFVKRGAKGVENDCTKSFPTISYLFISLDL